MMQVTGWDARALHPDSERITRVYIRNLEVQHSKTRTLERRIGAFKYLSGVGINQKFAMLRSWACVLLPPSVSSGCW